MWGIQIYSLQFFCKSKLLKQKFKKTHTQNTRWWDLEDNRIKLTDGGDHVGWFGGNTCSLTCTPQELNQTRWESLENQHGKALQWVLRKHTVSQARAPIDSSTPLYASPLPWIFKCGALWCPNISGLPLTGGLSCWSIKGDGCGPLFSWEGIYREARHLSVGHYSYNMAEVMKEVKEESEIEIDTRNLEQQASSARGRRGVWPIQWLGQWVSDYPTHVPPLHPPTEDYPALAWHKAFPQCPPFLSNFFLPILLH